MSERDATSRRGGRRYYVTLRRTVVETQSVSFISNDGDLDSRERQVAVAAAYARPEDWQRTREACEITDLSSEAIRWDGEPTEGIQLSAESEKDDRPHSRACGMTFHPHGPDCSKDCPTCHAEAS